MTVAIEAPPPAAPADTDPLFVQPAAADKAPRRAEPAPPKAMPHDPEAPFGYMTDPVTGQVRPKKTAGRQKTGTGRKAPAPPKKRASNMPRVAPPPAMSAAPVPVADHAQQVGGLVDMAWMVAAAMPVPKEPERPKRFDLHSMSVRARAMAYVLGEHRATLAQHGGTIADNVPSVAARVESWSSKDGKAWVIPVMLGLLPFAAAMSAIARAPLTEIREMADKTTAQFHALAQTELARMQAAAAEQAMAEANGRVLIPGEQPLPGMVG